MRSPSPPGCLSTALMDFLLTLCTPPPSLYRPPTWRVQESASERKHVSAFLQIQTCAFDALQTEETDVCVLTVRLATARSQHAVRDLKPEPGRKAGSRHVFACMFLWQW